MPKVTMKCIDCRKERTAHKSCFNNKLREEYRCKRCALKKVNSQKISIKITRACVDCGKEKVGYPSYFRRVCGGKEYRCRSCALKKYSRNPVQREIRRIRLKKLMQDPVLRTKRMKGLIEFVHKRVQDPAWQKWRVEENRRIVQDPKWRKAQKEGLLRKGKDPEYRKMRKKSAQERSYNPIWINNHKIGILERSQNLVWIENLRTSAIKRLQDPIKREYHLIATIGEGFWYGNRSLRRWNNRENKYYCESWNSDLWRRIDAAYDYKSIISGKTRFENYRDEYLSRHHIYWQEKACCIWDEDKHCYYASLNLGTGGKSNIVRYYIEGDPNKFVLLTRQEHGMVRGSKKSGRDKVHWIKYFEDLIEQREKEGKKCYLSPEEYEVYKIKNAGKIAYFTQKIKPEIDAKIYNASGINLNKSVMYGS